MNKLIELGTCKKPHGVKGAFSFYLINQRDSSLEKGRQITLFPMDESSSIKHDGEIFEIESIGFGNKTIVTLKGVNNRNLVESMIPFSIHINRDELPDLDDDNYYINDLGLKVYNESNEYIGEVSDINSNGVQDILQIKSNEIMIDILLIEQFVKEIIWDEEKIIVVVPELI